MFEQSLLIDHTGARKTATLAVSFTAQIFVAGVLLVVPLLYHEVLPALREPAMMPMLSIWRPPAAPFPTPEHFTRSTGLAAPSPFRPSLPNRPDYPQTTTVIADFDAPIDSAIPGAAAFPVGTATSLPAFEPPPPKPEAVKPPDAPVRVGGAVQSAKLIKQVVPMYPRPATQFRISGTVRLLGIIAKDGTIQRLQVLSGHPMLRQAAIDAVSQWVYRPTVLNGEPVEVEAPIDVIFSLAR
jgi:protein TonB